MAILVNNGLISRADFAHVAIILHPTEIPIMMSENDIFQIIRPYKKIHAGAWIFYI